MTNDTAQYINKATQQEANNNALFGKLRIYKGAGVI